MNAGVGGKIIKLTIESGFSRGVLANCIYEREMEWRGRGLFEGWWGVPVGKSSILLGCYSAHADQ